MSGIIRSVSLLFLGLVIITVALAAMNTMVPLWLVSEAFAANMIGLVASAYFIGNLIGTVITGRIIESWGFNKSYYLACFIMSISIFALFWAQSFTAWVLLRFVAGVACSMLWIIIESAVLYNSSWKTRGKFLAFYGITYYVGTLVGQLIITNASTQIEHILPLCAILSLVAMIPLFFVTLRSPKPRLNSVDKPSFYTVFKLSQAWLGTFGCLVSGVVLGSLYSMLPVYLSHKGISDANVGFWMACLVFAGIVGQWPTGLFADSYGRKKILYMQLVMIIIGSALVIVWSNMLLFSLILLGLFSFPLYPIVMAWACEVVNKSELVRMNQIQLLTYTIGSLIGPPLVGYLMLHYHGTWLFGVVIGIAIIYMLVLMTVPVKKEIRVS